MSYFPIICKPYSFEKAQNSLPPDIPFSENPPIELGDKPIDRSGYQPKQVNGVDIARQTAIAAIFAPFVSSILHISGWLLFLCAVGAIAYIARIQYRNYPDRMKAYRLQVAKYDKAIQDYERRKHIHDNEVQEYQRRKHIHDEKQEASAPRRISQWRHKQIVLALSKTVSHDGENSSAPEGRSELKFRSYLEQYFPGKTHKNLTCQIPGFPHPYTPDIAYIDPSTKLCIDIEIDEPYYQNNKAIHYDTSETDYKRNQFFVGRGWIVIRFSEQQVVCYPDSCCKVVAQEIAKVTGDKSVTKAFVNVPDLPQQKQWTEAEALQMAARKERDNYSCLRRQRLAAK